MATRLDEGLEDFFSRRVMDESSRYAAGSLPSADHRLCEGSFVLQFPGKSLQQQLPPTHKLPSWANFPASSPWPTHPLALRSLNPPQGG